MPVIVDQYTKQVNEVPKNLNQNPNIYNHKKHHSKPKLSEISSNPNIIDINHSIERLVLEHDDVDKIKSMDDTDKFIFDNMKKHNDKHNPKFPNNPN